jgi:hypothetical protein
MNMKNKLIAQPQAGSPSLHKIPVKDGDVLNIRHFG